MKINESVIATQSRYFYAEISKRTLWTRNMRTYRWAGFRPFFWCGNFAVGFPHWGGKVNCAMHLSYCFTILNRDYRLVYLGSSTDIKIYDWLITEHTLPPGEPILERVELKLIFNQILQRLYELTCWSTCCYGYAERGWKGNKTHFDWKSQRLFWMDQSAGWKLWLAITLSLGSRATWFNHNRLATDLCNLNYMQGYRHTI